MSTVRPWLPRRAPHSGKSHPNLLIKEINITVEKRQKKIVFYSFSIPTAISSDSSQPSKRNKTSESFDAHVNLVDEDEDETLQLQRPIGRDKAKKASGSNTTGPILNEIVSNLFLSQK